MKFLSLLMLGFATSCSVMPFIAEEALEIIEEGVEAELREHMTMEWYDEGEKEADFLRRYHLEESLKESYVIRIRPKKWPYGFS